MSDHCGKCGETMCICERIEKQPRKEVMSKSELKRLCAQNPVEMAERIVELEQRVEEQKRTIEALNTCIGGKDSLTTDNITRIEELEQRVKMLMEAIHLAQIASCSCATMTNEISHHSEHCLYRILGEALDATRQQTAEQIERWHRRRRLMDALHGMRKEDGCKLRF